VSKIIKSTVGYVVQARFIIELQLRDIYLLLKIQSFFGGVGTITKDPIKNVCRFSVVSIKDINNFIIPHFVEYPLQSAKFVDFSLWSQIARRSRGARTSGLLLYFYPNRVFLSKHLTLQ
jgi:hypothetical protein